MTTFKYVLSRAIPFYKILQGFDAWQAHTCPPGADPRLQQAVTQLDAWLHLDPSSHGASLGIKLHNEQQRHRIQVPVYARSPWTHLPHEVFFLHFFSGRRRHGDLQEALERCALPPGHCLSVLSIDVQVCPDRCNLRLADHQRRWLDLLWARLVLGVAAGPPCETWSRARGSAPDPDDLPSHKMPRPLRSRNEPWGKLPISAAESTQVEVGNDLMTWSLQAAWIQAVLDGFSMLEHPQDPDEYMEDGAQHPSIWSTAILAWFEASSLFSKIAVMQGRYGAPSPKPTTLYFAGVPKLHILDLEPHCRTRPMPSGRSIGKQHGQWRTTVLKEYPPALCSFIAKVFQLHLDRKAALPPSESRVDHTWLKGLCIALKPTDLTEAEKVGIGSDFFRGRQTTLAN